MLMIDLFSGLGGASRVMVERGWRVITVDNDPRFGPTVVADVTRWRYSGPRPDLVWASPPCTEFARESMPWCRRRLRPCTMLATAAARVIVDDDPRFFVVENVRGSVRYLEPIFGPVRLRHGPFYLYGHFPELPYLPPYSGRGKQSRPGSRPDLRAVIPEELSFELALAIELA